MTTEAPRSDDQTAKPVTPQLRLPRLPKIKGLPRLRSLSPELRQVDRVFYSLTPSLAHAAAGKRSTARDKENPLRRYRSMLRKLSIGNAVRTLLAERLDRPEVPSSPRVDDEPRQRVPADQASLGARWSEAAQPVTADRVQEAPLEQIKEILRCAQDDRCCAQDDGHHTPHDRSSAHDDGHCTQDDRRCDRDERHCAPRDRRRARDDRPSARRAQSGEDQKRVGLNRKNRAAVDQKAVSRCRRPHNAIPTCHLPPATYSSPSPSRPISAEVKRFARLLAKWARALFAGRHAHASRGHDSAGFARRTCSLSCYDRLASTAPMNHPNHHRRE